MSSKCTLKNDLGDSGETQAFHVYRTDDGFSLITEHSACRFQYASTDQIEFALLLKDLALSGLYLSKVTDRLGIRVGSAKDEEGYYNTIDTPFVLSHNGLMIIVYFKPSKIKKLDRVGVSILFDGNSWAVIKTEKAQFLVFCNALLQLVENHPIEIED